MTRWYRIPDSTLGPARGCCERGDAAVSRHRPQEMAAIGVSIRVTNLPSPAGDSILSGSRRNRGGRRGPVVAFEFPDAPLQMRRRPRDRCGDAFGLHQPGPGPKYRGDLEPYLRRADGIADLRPLASPSVVGTFVVDESGRSLAMECWGSRDPTVFIESGEGAIDEFRGSALVEALASQGRVCLYNRAGRPPSDPPPDRPREAEDVAGDFKALTTDSGHRATVCPLLADPSAGWW